MIKIEKTITIDGEDVQALSNICEAARIYFEQNKRKDGYYGIFCPEEIQLINKFLDVIWDR